MKQGRFLDPRTDAQQRNFLGNQFSNFNDSLKKINEHNTVFLFLKILKIEILIKMIEFYIFKESF